MITPPGLPPGCPPWFARPAARAWTCAPVPTAGIRAFHTTLPGYAPTPLREVPAVAAELGVGRVFVKDESARGPIPATQVPHGTAVLIDTQSAAPSRQLERNETPDPLRPGAVEPRTQSGRPAGIRA